MLSLSLPCHLLLCRLTAPLLMADSNLNHRLHVLSDRAADAPELLRGVTDALAVIGQCASRAATDDARAIDDPDAWRQEAESALHQSEALLRKAAVLLNRATDTVEATAEELAHAAEINATPDAGADGESASEATPSEEPPEATAPNASENGDDAGASSATTEPSAEA